jgi:hypothetical protein
MEIKFYFFLSIDVRERVPCYAKYLWTYLDEATHIGAVFTLGFFFTFSITSAICSRKAWYWEPHFEYFSEWIRKKAGEYGLQVEKWDYAVVCGCRHVSQEGRDGVVVIICELTHSSKGFLQWLEAPTWPEIPNCWSAEWFTHRHKFTRLEWFTWLG